MLQKIRGRVEREEDVVKADIEALYCVVSIKALPKIFKEGLSPCPLNSKYRGSAAPKQGTYLWLNPANSYVFGWRVHQRENPYCILRISKDALTLPGAVLHSGQSLPRADTRVLPSSEAQYLSPSVAVHASSTELAKKARLTAVVSPTTIPPRMIGGIFVPNNVQSLSLKWPQACQRNGFIYEFPALFSVYGNGTLSSEALGTVPPMQYALQDSQASIMAAFDRVKPKRRLKLRKKLPELGESSAQRSSPQSIVTMFAQVTDRQERKKREHPLHSKPDIIVISDDELPPPPQAPKRAKRLPKVTLTDFFADAKRKKEDRKGSDNEINQEYPVTGRVSG